ncbi:hypothetical protein [Pandoraea sp. NPDC090278]|uniref:hypothetical protein n=1 Tax=Pandoraea sp. NPDC090278 TaxID=3364391 RepID=UPI00383B3B57
MKSINPVGKGITVKGSFRQWKSIFIHAPAGITLCLILTHQSIIASSSFFLTRVIEAFQHQRPYQLFLLLYLVAMLIPYVPGCASFVALQSWINRAHHEFVKRFSCTAYGLISANRDDKLRVLSESVVARSSFLAIRDYLTFIHGFLGFFLNSTLSILVLGILLPGDLLTGYLVTLTLCAAVIVLLRTTIARKSAETEMQFASYGQSLTRIWANTTLGNRYHFEKWSHETNGRAESYYTASFRLQCLKQVGNLALALTSLGPTIFLVWRVVVGGHADPALVAAIIVNLTRIFHILNSLSALVYQVLDLSSMNARLQVLFATEQDLLKSREYPTGPVGEMTMNGEQVTSYSTTAQMLMSENIGRFTLRGENGAGKSTFLNYLKGTFGDRALLLPAQQSDLVWQRMNDAGSTGQCALRQLEEASSVPDIQVLLLDEWDANLDQANRIAVDKMLGALSQEKLIVEIRH